MCIEESYYNLNGLPTLQASGYATLANHGIYREPTCISSIKNKDGQELYHEYQEKEAAITSQIESEQLRSEEIAEFEKYTQTRKYIEDTARDKLGLVYPGEIIFKNDSK